MLLGVLGVLAVVFPPAVGPAPVEGIEVTRPLWMFWWLLTLEGRWGVKAILWGTGVLFALLVAVPFLDRSPQRRLRKRPLAAASLGIVLAIYIVLTLITAFTSSAAHLE